MMDDSFKPRPYDLSIHGEFQRLMRECCGYLSTCRREHHGTDWEGRRFAIVALESIQSNELTPDELLDAIFEAFRSHSSPTVDMGDSHGARGQSGMLIWKSSHPFIRRAILDAMIDVGLRVLVEEMRDGGDPKVE